MNRSVPTSMQVEFVNVSPLNPSISRCEIKVLYTGLNRNRSFITKETANTMAKSLPGTPIVGEFLAEDFGDHGEENLVINENGIRFVKSTVPYGFVPTDAKIWWQTFLDKDGVEREYLLTEGYLWTGRYPECSRAVEKGNGQSMELDRDSLTGEWTKNENSEFEYFNISEALFSALCILGENVEPCFEGANITKPQMMYSLDKDDFKSQMNSFMLDLKDALSIEGGSKVENLDNKLEGTEPEVQPEVEAEDFAKKKKDEEEEKDTSKDTKKDEPNKDEVPAKKEDAPAKKEDDSKADAPKDDKQADDEEEKKKKKAKYDLEEVVEYVELSKEYLGLQAKFEKLQADFEALQPVLAQFEAEKTERENKAKEDMFQQFYMLDEEDVKEIKENMTNFTLEEIESKLCVIAVRKKVNFNLDTNEKSDKEVEKVVTTFDLGNSQDSTPAWLKAVDKRVNKK